MMYIFAIPALWYIRTFRGKVDESFGLLEKQNLGELISQGNWQEVESKMSALSPNQFSRVIMELCSGKIWNQEIEEFIQSSETEFSNLIAGCYYTSVGYLKRSGAWAKELSEDQVDGMFEYLEKAEEQLSKDYENDRYQMEAAGRMIGVLMNTGTKEDAAHFFNRVQSTNFGSNHWLTHYRYFRTSTPRWGGSNEAMLALIDSAEDKSIRDMLRVMTLIEMFSDLYNEDDETAVQEFRSQRKSLIHQALDNKQIPNDDSIIHIYTKNYLAMLHNILGRKNDRNQLIGELKNRISMYPWAYFGMLCERDVKIYKGLGLLEF